MAKATTTATKPLDSELTAKLINFIAEHMALEEAELTPNASLSEDLHLDEIDVAELMMRAEEELEAREFDDAEWEECKTVGDFIRLVSTHTDQKKSKAAKKE